MRSPYVGKEFNDGPLNGLFASTPPLEVLRSLISEAATIDAEEEEEKIIAVDDVSHAFFRGTDPARCMRRVTRGDFDRS